VAHTKHGRKRKSAFGRLNSSSATKAERYEQQRGPAALKLRRLGSELNQRKIDLMSVDIDVAGTFASIAQGATDDAQKRSRNQKHARDGYDTVARFMRTASMPENQRRDLQKRLAQLKAVLSELGEVFPQ
jgi:hypothetical protein